MVGQQTATAGLFTPCCLARRVFGGCAEPALYTGGAISLASLTGLAALPFAPPTKGRPLPESGVPVRGQYNGMETGHCGRDILSDSEMRYSWIGAFLRAALLWAAGACSANASTIQASLFFPLWGEGPVAIDLAGTTAPSQHQIFGTGYSVSFAVDSDQGVVRGASSGRYAIPVGGVTAGDQPAYLTGDFGSALTASASNAGNYFSTGIGTITITFNQPEYWLALLWGSIDTGNSVSFNDAGNFLVTGTDVQQAAAGFVSNGFQGPGGSAYVIVHTDTPFTTVTASSSTVSFEFGGLAASEGGFSSVPEPGSAWLLGIGLGGAAMRRLITL